MIGQKDGSYIAAYVYWPTENRLVLWVPDPHEFNDYDNLTDSFSNIDLKNGVVENENDDAPIDEMALNYINIVLHICRVDGKKFLINKSN